MAADFPASLAAITRVNATDKRNDPGKEGDVLHNKVCDEVEALQAVVGVTGSAVSTTLEARMADRARLSGAAGGQTLIGGTAASENLTLLSTSNATKGAIIFGASSEYDHSSERLGLGTLTPAARLHAISTTEQMRLGYDASNYASVTVSATGLVTIAGNIGQYSLAGHAASLATATLGSELLANDTFAADLSSWTAGAGWSWASGGAQHTAGNTATLAQDAAVTNGATYQLDIVISGRTAGSIAVALGSVSVIEGSTATAFTSTLSRTVIAGASGAVSLAITPTTDFNGKIDSVSLKAVTLGSFPTLLGFSEGGSVGTEIRQAGARSCLSIGKDAGRSMTTGSSNSNLGTGAGRSITTGSTNCNFGVNAGYSITTGSNNCNFGVNAGFNITTGYSNVCFGVFAGQSLTTGNSNLIFGANTLVSLTTGNNNTALGTTAGRGVTTGSGNVFCGVNAGRYLADGSTALTTPSNGTYIGQLTKASADGVTAENVFGYNAVGIGSNTTCIGASSNTKTQIYGDIVLDKTVTAGGTTGAQTINKTCGSVNFAAGATSLVVTDSRVSTSSVIVATVATNDTTMKTVLIVAASGSFTIRANAAATAETRVNFIVIN